MIDYKKSNVYARVLAILLTVSLIPATVVSADDEWQGWTEDTIEDAWNVYAMTTWADVRSLRFSVSGGGSIAHANVPDAFRTQYQPVIDSVLSNCSYALQFKSDTNSRNKTQYTELFLAIGYALSMKGAEVYLGAAASEQTVMEPAYLWVMLGYTTNPEGTSGTSTIEWCYRELVRLYYQAERYYLVYHAEEAAQYSIYSNDGYLQAVIQGMYYGSEYARDNNEYTVENATTYYDSHTADFETTGYQRFDDLAMKVMSYYSAVRSVTDEYVVG